MFGIQHKELFDQVDTIRRYPLKLSVIEMIVQGDDLLEDNGLTVTLEG